MESLLSELSRISDYGTYGRVVGVQGLLIVVCPVESGPSPELGFAHF